MEKDKELIKKLSKRNLNEQLEQLKKYKYINNSEDAELAVNCFPLIHCVRGDNVLGVINDGEIKTKNLLSNASVTGFLHDYVQGFDSHISMSIGRPWLSYGQLAISYSLDELGEDTLFFYRDPYLMNTEVLSKNFLIKEDFIILAKEIVMKNIYYKIQFPAPLKPSTLLMEYFKDYEVKVHHNLKLKDCSCIRFYGLVDSYYIMFARWFNNKIVTLVLLFILLTSAVINLLVTSGGII